VTAEDDDQAPEQPWHHSTSAVAGASVAALGVIALLVWGVVSLTGSADNPQEAPTQFVDPTFVSSTPTTSTTTTTATITTTTGPVITSEIMGPPDTATTSGSDTSSPSDTTSTAPSTTGPSTTGELPTTRTHAGDTSTSRPRLRTNVTRTLYPAPGN
jgi:hypothetical protein